MPSFTTISQESSSSSSSTSDLEEIKERTVFERIKFIYCKDFKSDISIKRCYDTDFDEKGFTKELELAIKKENDGAFETFSINLSGKSFLVWQIASTDVIRGVVTESFEPSDFDKWFLHLVASTSKVDFSPDLSETSYVADIICDEFVATLKKTAKVDKWDSGGREFFKEGIEFFVTKGITIEAVLPAFPCKSSNSKKVATSEPDKGEELAIRRLIQFAHNVKKIYPPGMIVWIVSDGHVFSDCIGVDDDIVDEYTEKVKNLYSSLDPQNVDEVIKFASLKDIFNFQQFPMKKELVEHVHLEHYLSTKLDDYSELCRKVLVHSCDTDSGKLREDVNTKDHPRLFLYRGFSKFMTEDLASHPVTVKLTRKKFRKVVSRIAFEMIKRNDAYSNLVDLMFPKHLRFSIHAHSNSGPKFGISLWDSDECRVVRSLDLVAAPNFDDLLHIPTPWHNCVLKLEDSPHYFVTISDVIRNALEKGTHTGNWDKKEKCFLLKKLTL